MIRSFQGILLVLTLFAVTTQLHAQTGCTNSPEAPTGILLLVGLAGISLGSPLSRKILRPLARRVIR
jgi:XrtJ-associated TM-motif-TM protein